MQNQGQGKFKTMLCKHFETPKGCVYKDKCQFAHGAFELKSVVNVNFFIISPLLKTIKNLFVSLCISFIFYLIYSNLLNKLKI